MTHGAQKSVDAHSKYWIPWTTAGLAGKSALARLKGSVTLASILAGDTCSPISLQEFEGYLTFVEHSVENLQFLIWFQDYRRRFDALPEEVRRHSPGGPTTLSFGVPSLASTARRREAALASQSAGARDPLVTVSSIRKPAPLWVHSRAGGDHVLPEKTSPCPTELPSRSSQFTQMPLSPISPVATSPMTATSSRSFIHSAFGSWDDPPVPSDATFSGFTTPHLPSADNTDLLLQPFHEECLRVITTFFRPGSKKELPIDEEIKELVLDGLAWSTHPDVFIPAYEAVYNVVETSSIPQFLRVEITNINISKQWFWYFVGLTDSLIGIAIAVSLITSVSTPPETHRAYRLFSLPFAAFGAMQIYSAWRGFCSVVWGRRCRQLKAWELEELEEDVAYRRCAVPQGAPADSSISKQPRIESFASNMGITGFSLENGDYSGASMGPLNLKNPIFGDDFPSGTPTSISDSREMQHRFMDKRLIAPFATPPGSEDGREDDDGGTIDTDVSKRCSDGDMALGADRVVVAAVANEVELPFRSARIEAIVSKDRGDVRRRQGFIANGEEGDIPNSCQKGKGRVGYLRPPIFGPEVVIKDPHIIAVHEQTMRDIGKVGAVWTIIFAAIVLSVPGRHS